MTMLIVAVLILLNGLFVAAEFAIVGVSRVEIERGVRSGSSSARLVRWVISDPLRHDRFIATAQLGITAASLGLGMYGEQAFAHSIEAHLGWWQGERWLAAHTLASIVAIGVLTYFHIVIGEMVPKSVALHSPGWFAMLIAPIVRGLQIGVYPLILGLNTVGNALLAFVGVRRSEGGAEHYRTPEELAYIVRESQAGGMLRKESARVVGDLLEFGERTAAEIMVPRVRVAALPLDAHLSELKDLLRTAPHTRYPVYDGTLDHIVGMLHVRDALRSLRSGAGAPEHVRPVPHLPATAHTDQLLAAMRQAGVQMAVIMDEHGGTAGIVTLEDLFEEVVGDITERPSEVPEIVVEAPRRVRVDGAARIDEVGDALGVVLEHEEVDSVSGLVLALLGRRPTVGDRVEFDGVHFEVASLRGNGVGTSVAWLPEPSAATEESDED
ncbi:MAG: HlyC/CorC family transporter [Gemmatimonadetes bacterium]|nr:HlyC/CorC family transporter [Gemmatimonadota bacterium]